MSAHVLLNLLNEFGEKDNMRGFAEDLIWVHLFYFTE